MAFSERWSTIETLTKWIGFLGNVSSITFGLMDFATNTDIWARVSIFDRFFMAPMLLAAFSWLPYLAAKIYGSIATGLLTKEDRETEHDDR